MKKVDNWEKGRKEMNRGDICPICKWGFSICQCRFSGSAHPDRTLIRQVVLDHLFLLSKKQLKHIIKLERECCVFYADDERNMILELLKNEQK